MAKVPVAVRVLCPVVAAAVVVAALVVVSGNGSPQASPIAASDTYRPVSAEVTTVGSSVESTSSAVPTTTAGSATESTSSAVQQPVAATEPVVTTPRVQAPWFVGRVGEAAQVISVVGAGGSNATLSSWQRVGDDWTPVVNGIAAKVGPAGISGSYGESSSTTPAGVFAITGAFGNHGDPGVGVPYFRIVDSDWWVSDVDSPDYNTHQRCARGTCPFDEGTSENLAEQGGVYDYALVMGVNAQRVPGAGSAFFVHVTDGAPTAGCVAIPASTLASIMTWVGPGTVIALSPR